MLVLKSKMMTGLYSRGKGSGGRERPQFQKCRGKTCYPRKKIALTVKNTRYKQDHEELRIYDCPHCRMWHLTKQSLKIKSKDKHHDKKNKLKQSKKRRGERENDKRRSRAFRKVSARNGI